MASVNFGDQGKVSDRLYQDLLNGISTGEYKPRETLPTEARLSEIYGVSRTTVRMALSHLKDGGYVASKQGSGTVVTEQSPSQALSLDPVASLRDLEHCYECRMAIETAIARAASKLRTDEDLVYFDNHLAGFENSVINGTIVTAEDTEFHQRLARISQNRYFESIMLSLRPHAMFGMNLFKNMAKEERKKHSELVLQEHKAIVEAIIVKDADKAGEAMKLHIEAARIRIFHGI